MPRFNQPAMRDEHGNNMVRRFVHQQLTGDHGDIHYKINSNGKVDITVPDRAASNNDEMVYDQVTVPASLIFKLAQLLKATRDTTYVAVTTDKAETATNTPAAVNSEKE